MRLVPNFSGAVHLFWDLFLVSLGIAVVCLVLWLYRAVGWLVETLTILPTAIQIWWHK